MKVLDFSSVLEVTSRHVKRVQRGYVRDYTNYLHEGPPREAHVICNALNDRPYSFKESEALEDMFLIQQRKLTNDEVTRVLFLVALEGYWESIPF